MPAFWNAFSAVQELVPGQVARRAAVPLTVTELVFEPIRANSRGETEESEAASDVPPSAMVPVEAAVRKVMSKSPATAMS